MSFEVGHTVHHYFKVKKIDDVAKVQIDLNTKNNRTFKFETPQFVNKEWVVWYHVSQYELTKALLKLNENTKEGK